MSVRMICADVMNGLAQLADESVHCVVTSPPYWGLRDYGVEGQIGLESTPEAFVARLVEVFHDVRRVLRKDGTLWLNLGDSYAGSWGAQGRQGQDGQMATRSIVSARQIAVAQKRTSGTGSLSRTPGIKSKDLIGIPWMVAFALRADGWYLRQDIVWHKPNPMPESVRDRCTKAHEYLFLLTKSKRYFFDAKAIKETCSPNSHGSPNVNPGSKQAILGNNKGGSLGKWVTADKQTGRNKRSVWTISTTPYKEAHFATFPVKLAETCIKAGCPEGGTVLDPFGGAGTTALVADRLGHNTVLIELKQEYIKMAERRLARDRVKRCADDPVRRGCAILDKDPARRKRLEAEWIAVMGLIEQHAGCVVSMVEINRMVEYARIHFFTVILDQGVPDDRAWIYALHAIGLPAARKPC